MCGPRIFCDPALTLFFSALLSFYVLQIPFALIPKSPFFVEYILVSASIV